MLVLLVNAVAVSGPPIAVVSVFVMRVCRAGVISAMRHRVVTAAIVWAAACRMRDR